MDSKNGLELLSFLNYYCNITAAYDDSLEMNEEEANYTIEQWTIEGMDLPGGLTGKILAEYWTSFINEVKGKA